MLVGLIKDFSLTICSIYIFSKILNITISRKIALFVIPFSGFASFCAYLVRIYFPALKIFTLFIFLFFFCLIVFKKNTAFNFSLSFISLGTSYILFTLSFTVLLPLLYVTFIFYRGTQFLDISAVVLGGVFQFLIAFLFFRIKRFRTGIPNIEKNHFNAIVGSIAILVLLIASLINFGIELDIFFFLYCIVILSGLIAYFEWKKHITNTYQKTIHLNNIKILERTIENQNTEIVNLKTDMENLSKIIHKDNKLIPAMELAVKEVCLLSPSDKISNLLTALEQLALERKGIVYVCDTSHKKLQETEIVTLDALLSYLLQRASSNNTTFDLSLLGKIKNIVPNILSENDLRTMVADLGENAIIATKNIEDGRVLLTFGITNTHFYMYFFDNGAYFDAKVIQKMGKTRYTTHEETGGSGIGLMQIFELLNKYQASFEMEEFNTNSLYKKRISIIFDGLSKTTIISNRKEVQTVCSKRSDLIIIN